MANFADLMNGMFQSRSGRAVDDMNELKLKQLMDMLSQRQGQEVAAGALMNAQNPDGSPRMFPGINRTEIQRSAPIGSGQGMMANPGEIIGARQVPMQAPQPMMDERTRAGFERTAMGGPLAQWEMQQAQKVAAAAPYTLNPGDQRMSGGKIIASAPFKPDEMTPWQQQQAANQDRQFALAESRLGAAEQRTSEAEARRNRPQPTAYVSRIDGNPVFMDPQNQTYTANGQAIAATDLVPAPDYNKEVEKARGVVSGIDRAEAIKKKVDDNKSAFSTDKVNAARLRRDFVPFVGDQMAAAQFTPDENLVRADVSREAAMIINELYGAALSAGEDKRASTFAPGPNDTLEMLLPKLESAIEWGRSQEKALIPSAAKRARAMLNIGGKQQSTRPAGPPPIGKNGKPMVWTD